MRSFHEFPLVPLLFLLFAGASAAAPGADYFAPGTPDAEALGAKVQEAAYDLLCQRMLFDHDKLDRCFAIARKARSDFFSVLGLPARMGRAALSTKEIAKRGIAAEVEALRTALRKEGAFDLLKDKRMRKALVYMERSGLFERFEKENEETLTFCREMRRSARCKACAAFQKCVHGAIEMHRLDNEADFPDGPVDQTALVAAGYLKAPCVCPSDPTARYAWHASTETVSCSLHGGTEETVAKASVRGDPSEDVKRMWEHNAVFKALDGEMKKVSPDGKGLVRTN